MPDAKPIQVLMRDTDEELLAYWGASGGIRGTRQDAVSQTPHGQMFVGIVAWVERGTPMKSGYRHATLGEVMHFLRHCLENKIHPGVDGDSGVAALGTTIWLPGNFYGTPYCLHGSPRKMEMTDGRFGFPGGNCLLVRVDSATDEGNDADALQQLEQASAADPEGGELVYEGPMCGPGCCCDECWYWFAG